MLIDWMAPEQHGGPQVRIPSPAAAHPKISRAQRSSRASQQGRARFDPYDGDAHRFRRRDGRKKRVASEDPTPHRVSTLGSAALAQARAETPRFLVGGSIESDLHVSLCSGSWSRRSARPFVR